VEVETMKNICNVVKNWWDYYLIKWGIKNSASIYMDTKPDTMQLILNKQILQYGKGIVKVIFRLIKENRLEYYRESNEMVIYDEGKKVSKRLKFDFIAIGTVERLVNLHLNFKPFDSDLFIVDIGAKYKILIRKNIVSDIGVVAEIILRNEYEILRTHLKDAIVLDIGAYIGDSAIKFILEGANKVHSYEPHPELYNLACKNVNLNNLDSQIVLKNFGIGDKQASLTIKEDGYFGASSSFGLNNRQRCKGVVVKLLSLDSIILEIGNIDVMKMDCEGAEFSSILSCPQETLRKIKVMVIEYHNEPEPLISYLKKTGFEVKKMNENIISDKKTGLLFAELKE
jgi:FkbM family methyltransferase